MENIKYELVKSIGVIGVNESGWTKEINYMSWNEREPKYDIRDWSPDRKKIGKGVTFTKEEMTELKQILEELE
jgi:hypothetical protein